MENEKDIQSPVHRVSEFLDHSSSKNSEPAPVIFKDLTVIGSGYKSAVAPTILSLAKSPLALVPTKNDVPTRKLIHSWNGVVKPGEMVLVLGIPGSGCTTFLKTLAGLQEEFHSTEGTLQYGNTPIGKESEGRVRLTFCAEEDEHIPTLTVKETLKFALQSCMPGDTPSSKHEEATHALANLFDIGHTLNTRVGNAAVRGASGGERRRVSLAEALATQPDVLCLDNPTNGLDSSTAVEVVRMLREYTTRSGCATIMSLYQGSDSMMPFFDKALVINQGRQIYFGQADAAKPYFENMGHPCPETSTITDYLTSMSEETIPIRATKDRKTLPPSNTHQLDAAYKESAAFRETDEEVRSALGSTWCVSDSRRRFALPIWRQTLLCSRRHFRVLVTNYQDLIVEASCLIVQSIAIGTLFFGQTAETGSFFIISCSLFFCVLVPGLQSMAEFGATFGNRSLVMRQKRFGFYRPMSYALGLIMTDIFWKVFVIAYNIPQYFLTGFQYDARKFFIWFFVLYVEHMALSMVMRAVAVFSRNMSRALLPIGVIFNICVLYTGLYIPVPQMQVWLSWIRYLNPLYYAFESVMVNEFANRQYECSPNDTVPFGSSYTNFSNQVCAVPGSLPGQSTVEGSTYIMEQYGLHAENLWRNVGINLSIFIFFAFATGIGMELHKPPAGAAVTVLYRKETPEDHARSVDKSEGTPSDVEAGVPEDLSTNTLTDPSTTAPGTQNMGSHDGRTLMWRNLNLDIRVKGESKNLLHNLDGFIRPGSLTALMGASGAGKTTLLNTLAGRMETGVLRGDLFIDGKPLPKAFRRFMGYVQQQDIHLSTQTVREALGVAARLRRPSSVSMEEKEKYIDSVLSILDLDDLSNALIGSPGAGLTLEQRKRVSIAVELASHPEVLFLDEPTSGLDGRSAFNIVRLLRKLADSGQTVLCTIHQPAGEVIDTFDHLILLAKGGKLVYDGPLGPGCSTALDFLLPHSSLRNDGQNPAELLIEAVATPANTSTWWDIWQRSDANKTRQQQLQAMSAAPDAPAEADNQRGDTYAASFLDQLRVITRRAWIFNWRDPDYFSAKLFMNVANGLVNGLTYLNSDSSVGGMYNRVLSSFMSMIVGPPLGLQTESRFVALRDIFTLRDKAAMSYRWPVMILSAILVEMPYAMLTSFVYWVLWYFPVGYFTASSRAGYSFLMYQLFAIFVNSLAQLVASVMPTLQSTFMANGFFFMFINTLSGTLSPKSVTPSGWKWYYNVNPLFYFGEGITTTLTHGLEIECDEKELFSFQAPSGSDCSEYARQWISDATGYLVDSGNATECQYCRYSDGQSYYAQYEWDFSNRWRDIGVFVAFIAFNYMAVVLLTYLTRIHRWRK